MKAGQIHAPQVDGSFDEPPKTVSGTRDVSALLRDAKDALIDNNWERIAVRHLIARIDEALAHPSPVASNVSHDPDLIPRLRRVADSPESYPEIDGLLRNAADTLEALYATPEGGWFAMWQSADRDRQTLLEASKRGVTLLSYSSEGVATDPAVGAVDEGEAMAPINEADARRWRWCVQNPYETMMFLMEATNRDTFGLDHQPSLEQTRAYFVKAVCSDRGKVTHAPGHEPSQSVSVAGKEST